MCRLLEHGAKTLSIEETKYGQRWQLAFGKENNKILVTVHLKDPKTKTKYTRGKRQSHILAIDDLRKITGSNDVINKIK